MTVKVEKIATIHKGFTTLSRLTVSEGEARYEREIEDHGQAVAVLPYDSDRRVALLVQTPRLPVILAGETEHLLEAPAGLRDANEPPEDCARREAFEETGVALTVLEPVCTAWSSPGISTERLSLYLAPYRKADRTGAGGGLADENESILVVELPLAQLAADAEAGLLSDMKTFCLVQTLRLRRPDLF